MGVHKQVKKTILCNLALVAGEGAGTLGLSTPQCRFGVVLLVQSAVEPTMSRHVCVQTNTMIAMSVASVSMTSSGSPYTSR